MVATLTNDQIRYAGRKILLYRPLPAMDAFHRSGAKNRWLFGGNRCLGGEQEIYDPVAGVSHKVQDIRGDFHVWAWDGEGLVVAQARQPFRKSGQWLYTLHLSNGQSVVCSSTHVLLTHDGYRPLGELSVGDVLFLPASSADISRRVSAVEVNRFDDVWDFEVPTYHNYLASGVIHHNSGKSESNIGFDLCSFALGLHPYRKTPKAATIWAAANTWDLVGKLLWTEKIQAYLPMTQIESIVWHNKAADIPKELRLRNGNRIEFKAYEQGRKVFEGRAIDAFYGDEQCKSDAEGVWQEIQPRLLDKNGFSAQSMTPILYQPWLEDRIKALPDTDAVFYADLNQNRKSGGGYVDDSEIDAMIAEWAEEVQETRIKGHFAAFMGAVYKLFNRDTHVVKPFEIPADWPRWRSIDWGFNNPFVCLWLARDPDRRWYVYHEHYQARETLAYHAERIKQISGRERYRATWADHDAQDRYEFENLGIKTAPAKKDVHLGIEAVQATLKVQGDGRPRLFIFETCKHTVQEMTGYRWAEGTETTDARDDPLKVNDHTCLTGDTLVLMADGTEKPIANVSVGDRVRTSKGTQPVRASSLIGYRPVYRLVLSNGGQLRGTTEHEVFTPDGKRALGDLRPGQEVVTWNQSRSTDNDITGTGTTTSLLVGVWMAARGFMSRCGNMITGPSPRAITSTTSIEIPPTTGPKTCGAYRAEYIEDATHSRTPPDSGSSSASDRSAHLHQHGTDRPKAGNGTVSTARGSRATGSHGSTSASTAARSMQQRNSGPRSSARTSAERRRGAKQARTTNEGFATSAVSPLKSTSTRRRERVQVVAVHSCDGRSAVYDLTVANDHQFYANGILVSNCDSLRYGIFGVEGNFYFSQSDLS